jgi:hypothetical protein
MTKPFLLNQIIYVFWFSIQTFSWKWHTPHFSVLFPSSFQQSSALTHYKYLTVHKLVVNLACSVFSIPCSSILAAMSSTPGAWIEVLDKHKLRPDFSHCLWHPPSLPDFLQTLLPK